MLLVPREGQEIRANQGLRKLKNETPKKEQNIEYFENGHKKRETNFINNLPAGNQILFYESGKKKTCEHITIRKGPIAEIKITKWYENGQKKEEGTCLGIKKIGKHTKWYENGQIKEENNY